ncbi:ABC transporter permease subunit [Clostridium combesii]|uniref:ABC transporter permease n=1 Tax=Clostridium combesii TaxID=39481 RepID=A0A2G7HHI0_9CLOT|nr:ABC transporter permease subunit [Clostridium combesii]PIH04568.1 ABC transporter permease [Clostridium combesii]
MNIYIYQELKRVLIKKKIPLIIIFMFIIGYGIVTAWNAQDYREKLTYDNNKLNNLKATQDTATSEKKKESLTKDIKDIEKSISRTKGILNEIDNYDKSKLDKEISKLEKQNNPENEYKINRLKYYKQYNIEKYNIEPKATYTLLENTMWLSTLYMFIVIILLSDIVSGEYHPNTIKNLITKPISKTKIIISKFIVSTILSVGTIVIGTLILAIIYGIRLGFSDYKSSFDVGGKYILDASIPLTKLTSQMKYVPGSLKLIPLWIAVILLVLIIIVILISIASIVMFISTISRSSLISIFIDIVLTGGILYVYFFKFIGDYILIDKYSTILKILPIPYISSSIEILTGDISVRFNHSISIFFVLMVCLIWTTSMVFSSIYIFRKKNFD